MTDDGLGPEQRARRLIDEQLRSAGWLVQSSNALNFYAGRGIAVRESRLKRGFGQVDYLLYVEGQAVGVIEAKQEGLPLSGVEWQSGRYSIGLPDTLSGWRRPLPFGYESNGAETHLTDGLDLQPRAREVFAVHRPDTLAE